jgi:hypothetical protein
LPKSCINKLENLTISVVLRDNVFVVRDFGVDVLSDLDEGVEELGTVSIVSPVSEGLCLVCI